jgi:hypothetical protein
MSANSCTAVGDYINSTTNAQGTLIESWNGTTWSIVPSPNKGSGGAALLGVSCLSANSCKAVGYYLTLRDDVFHTLIQSWNGTAWSIVRSPNTGSSRNFLQGVSCLSASSCTAVGYSSNGAVAPQTLIESWNGTTWSIVPSPNIGTGSTLADVSCVSVGSCTAVGYYYNGATDQTLVETWNGISWLLTPSPSTGTDRNQLLGVSCVSASSCTAVGWYTSSSGFPQSLVESWNGITWLITPSPNNGIDQELLGVSCLSASSCTAVGFYANSSWIGQTVVESWNGTTWSIVASDNVSGANANQLARISCVPTGSCTGVGRYNTGNAFQTLIEVGSP